MIIVMRVYLNTKWQNGEMALLIRVLNVKYSCLELTTVESTIQANCSLYQFAIFLFLCSKDAVVNDHCLIINLS